MKINDVVTIDDGDKYIIEQILNHKGETYYFLLEVNEEETKIGTHRRITIKHEKNGQIILEDITNLDLLKELSEALN